MGVFVHSVDVYCVPWIGACVYSVAFFLPGIARLCHTGWGVVIIFSAGVIGFGFHYFSRRVSSGGDPFVSHGLGGSVNFVGRSFFSRNGQFVYPG